MAEVIKLRKGLTINLQGKAAETRLSLKSNGKYALVPDDFEGVTPKVVVKEGDTVKAGDALFINKLYPEVKFASPVSGRVVAVERGERRKVLCVKVEADQQQTYVDFGKKDVAKLNGEEVLSALLDAGIFGYINQLPYAVSTNPQVRPKAIFVSALRDKPLACDFAYEVKGQEQDFLTGLQALSKMAKTYLGIGIQPDFHACLQQMGVEQHVSLNGIVTMKRNVVRYYDSFYKQVFDERTYQERRAVILSIYLAVSTDSLVLPWSSGAKTIGDEALIRADYRRYLELGEY